MQDYGKQMERRGADQKLEPYPAGEKSWEGCRIGQKMSYRFSFC